ncbi:MAG: tetratricopeptide repeat protein [Bacteroidota bacterium]
METQLMQNYIYDAEQAIIQEQYLEGKAILEEALSIEPGLAKAHNHMGWLYLFHLNDHNAAEYHLRLAMKCEPEYGSPYLHLTTLLLERGAFDDVREILDKALDLKDLNKASVYYDYGRYYETMGKFNKAIKKYKEAIRHSMDHDEITLFRGNIKRCRIKWFLPFI